MSNFTEMDCYLFGQATHYDIYRKMGAHKMTIEGEEGVCFDVWAPHADRVYVIGEFNGWNETSHEMKRVTPETMGVYELFVPGVQIGCMYKFLIIAQDGRKLYKQTLMQIMHSCGRRQLPLSRIFPISSGLIANG